MESVDGMMGDFDAKKKEKKKRLLAEKASSLSRYDGEMPVVSAVRCCHVEDSWVAWSLLEKEEVSEDIRSTCLVRSFRAPPTKIYLNPSI